MDAETSSAGRKENFPRRMNPNPKFHLQGLMLASFRLNADQPSWKYLMIDKINAMQIV
jgi:hypothetical protein